MPTREDLLQLVLQVHAVRHQDAGALARGGRVQLRLQRQLEVLQQVVARTQQLRVSAPAGPYLGKRAHGGVLVLAELARAEQHQAENLRDVGRAAVRTVDLAIRNMGKAHFVDRLVERVDLSLEDRDEEGSHRQHQSVQLLSLLEDEVAQSRGAGRQLGVTSQCQACHVDHVLLVLAQCRTSLQFGNALLVVENAHLLTLVRIDLLNQSVDEFGADSLSLRVILIRHSHFQQRQECEELANLRRAFNRRKRDVRDPRSEDTACPPTLRIHGRCAFPFQAFESTHDVHEDANNLSGEGRVNHHRNGVGKNTLEIVQRDLFLTQLDYRHCF